MKKYVTFLLLVLFCSFVLFTEVSAGNIKVETTLDKEFEVQYTKVGEWKNGSLILKKPFERSGINLDELEKSKNIQGAIMELKKIRHIPDGKVVIVQGIVKIQDLETGVYLLEDITKENPSVQSALVTVPMWDEDEGEMSYDITWKPKVQKTNYSPETGDDTQMIYFIIICVISLLFVVRTLYFSLRLC